MSNRENLKNAILGSYLSGTPDVYKIKSPNGRHHVLVNKTSLAALFGNKSLYGIQLLNSMISKNGPKYIARNKISRRNVPLAYWKENPPPNWTFNNYVRKENYVFRKWNNNHGMVNLRGPFGAPIKLTNVNHHTLSKNNLRNLRAVRRQNTKNDANFARQQAAKNAERRKYVYDIKYYYPGPYGRNNITGTTVVNTNFKYIGILPRNATRVNNHNTSHIREKFRRWATATLKPNYNMRRVTINAYRLKN